MRVSILIVLNLSALITLARAGLEAYNDGCSASVYKRSLPEDEDVLFVLVRRADQPGIPRGDAAPKPLDPDKTRQVLELTRSFQNKKAQSLGTKAFTSAWNSARAVRRAARTYDHQIQTFRSEGPVYSIELNKNLRWQSILHAHHKKESKLARLKAKEEGRPAKDVVRKLKSMGVSEPGDVQTNES